MATLAQLPNIEQFVTQKVVFERMSYEAVSEEIKRYFGSTRGMSIRSVRRFCVKRGICRTSHLSDTELDVVVSNGVGKVSMHSLNMIENCLHASVHGVGLGCKQLLLQCRALYII